MITVEETVLIIDNDTPMIRARGISDAHLLRPGDPIVMHGDIMRRALAHETPLGYLPWHFRRMPAGYTNFVILEQREASDQRSGLIRGIWHALLWQAAIFGGLAVALVGLYYLMLALKGE